LPDALRDHVQRGVRNTRGEMVGAVLVANGDVGDRLEIDA
jgi:hypothetical protein